MDLPAPLAPTRATASPAPAANDTPRSAGTVAGLKGLTQARQPDSAAGNIFSISSSAALGRT